MKSDEQHRQICYALQQVADNCGNELDNPKYRNKFTYILLYPCTYIYLHAYMLHHINKTHNTSIHVNIKILFKHPTQTKLKVPTPLFIKLKIF